MNERKMAWGNFFKTMLVIAMPIAFQNFLSTTASMVDTIMIGSQGELAVAAVGICSQISSLFFSCYFGFAGGALLFFSQYWGAGNEKGINRTFGISLLFMFAVALLFSSVAISNPAFLLGIYTDKAHIVEVGVPYIRIVGFAYPLQVIAVIISFLMRSTERVKVPLFASLGSSCDEFLLKLGADLWTVRNAQNGTCGSCSGNPCFCFGECADSPFLCCAKEAGCYFALKGNV